RAAGRDRPGPVGHVRISPSRPLRSDPAQVPLRRSLDSGDASGEHDPVPPATVHTVEGVRTNAIDDVTDLIRREGDEIRIAPHEADEANVRHDRDGVADEKRSAAVCPTGPMQCGAALEVTA